MQNMNNEEKLLLITCLAIHDPKLLDNINKLYSGLLDNERISWMREAVGAELQEKGFGLDWEPNEYGLKLENLIDKLGILLRK
jgi:hypothetical protein